MKYRLYILTALGFLGWEFSNALYRYSSLLPTRKSHLPDSSDSLSQVSGRRIDFFASKYSKEPIFHESALHASKRSSPPPSPGKQKPPVAANKFFQPWNNSNAKTGTLQEMESLAPDLEESSELVPVDLPLFGTVNFPRVFWKGVMLFICVIWATNFAVIKKIFAALPDDLLDPSMYVALRFSIAATVMAPGAIGKFNNKDLVQSGLLVGLCVFVGYIGQSIGIQLSTANKTAFLCSMNVVWVALVNGIITKEFKLQQWVAVIMAVTGAAFIELKGFVMPEINDLWLLLQPLGFGTGYLVLERSMKKFPADASSFTSFKLMGVALLSVFWAAYNGHTLADVVPIMTNPVAGAGILYTSVVTTALAIWLQSITFKNVPATDASIILTSEPIWAAAFAYCKWNFRSLPLVSSSLRHRHV